MTEPEHCAECGFDGSRLTVADAIAALRTMRRRWTELFKDVPVEVLRRRPEANVWSPLEYAAHTRDVIAMNGLGMAMILEGSLPEVPDFPPDEDAPDRGYNVLEPKQVIDELGANADRMARRAEEVVGEGAWQRASGDGRLEAGWVLRHAVPTRPTTCATWRASLRVRECVLATRGSRSIMDTARKRRVRTTHGRTDKNEQADTKSQDRTGT